MLYILRSSVVLEPLETSYLGYASLRKRGRQFRVQCTSLMLATPQKARAVFAGLWGCGVDHEIRGKMWPCYSCVRVANDSGSDMYLRVALSSAVSTASREILYSLIVRAGWRLALHLRQDKRLCKAQPPMLCIYIDACSGFPVLVVPQAAFLTPLLMSFLALIKAPSLFSS